MQRPAAFAAAPGGSISARGEPRAGFALAELIIAITLSSVVLAAVYRVLVNNQRFYRSQSQIVEVRQNVRAVSQIMSAELRELAAADGDIVSWSDTSITIKSMRSFSTICAPPDPSLGRIVVRNSLTYQYRAPDPARDSALVFSDGNVNSDSDDTWLHAPVAGVTTGAVCADGAPGTSYSLTGMTGGTARIASVTSGSPVRTFEVVNYRLYDDGTGTWWLGVRTYSSGVWTATSPVAGPLRARDGIGISCYNAAGAATMTLADVAQIQIVIRGRSERPIQVQGRATGRYEDSLTVLVALRNN